MIRCINVGRFLAPAKDMISTERDTERYKGIAKPDCLAVRLHLPKRYLNAKQILQCLDCHFNLFGLPSGEAGRFGTYSDGLGQRKGQQLVVECERVFLQNQRDESLRFARFGG